MIEDTNPATGTAQIESQATPQFSGASSEGKRQPFFCDLFYQQLWQKAKDFYGWAVEYCAHKNESIDTLKGLVRDIENDGIWANLLESLSMGDDLLFNVFMPRDKYDILTHHPVNVTILSLKLGMGLNTFSKQDLKRLGLAALIHDLGMAEILMSIMNKDANLSVGEKRSIERHPSVTRSLVTQLGLDYEWLAMVVYQEHERENGQGYPEGLSGNGINLMAKVIGLMDTVDAMIHPRPWRRSIPPPDVIQALLTSQREFFASDLVKALIREVSPFPPGSYVRLNSKEIGQVIRVAKKHPLRPDMIIWFDSTGVRIREPKIVQLKSQPFLHIVGSVDTEELPSQTVKVMDAER
ncbi:MAG: HD-GYP domain-containing protein [bacterium]